ncbi:MAG: hypothetical protein K0M45_07605 [Candidatus Paracaedibacteraceae bacterium]|nr:hypothetical protein [Candidatus Paracaedibacteraceae bacterium]
MKIRSLFCLALLSSASYTAEPFNLDDLRGMHISGQKRALSEFLRRHNRPVPNLGVNHLIPFVQEINAALQQRQGVQQQQAPQQQQLLAPQIIQQNVQPVQAPVIPVAVNDAPRNQGGGNRQRLIQAQRRQQQEQQNEEMEDLRNQLHAVQQERQTLRQQNEQALAQLQQQLTQAPNEQIGRLEARIQELEEAERRAQQTAQEQQRQLEAAQQAPNEQIGRLQARIQQLEEAAQQTAQEQQRQLEAARQAPNEQMGRLQARIQQLEEAAQQTAQEQQRQLEQRINEAVNPLREQITLLDASNTERQARLDEVNLENQNLKRQLIRQEKSRAVEQPQMDGAYALNEVVHLLMTKNSEAENYKERITALEKKINDLQVVHDLTAKSLKTVKNDLAAEERKRPTTKKRKETHTNRLQELNGEVEKLEAQQERELDNLNQLQEQKSSLEEHFNSEIEKFSLMAVQLEELYKSLGRDFGSSQVRALHKELQEQEDINQSLRAQLAALSRASTSTSSSRSSGAPEIIVETPATSTSMGTSSRPSSSSSMMAPPPPPTPPSSSPIFSNGKNKKAASLPKTSTSRKDESSQAKEDRKGKGKADPEAEQETLTEGSNQPVRDNSAILQQIREHRRTSTLTSDEIDVLGKIEKEILKGGFNPKFTLSPRTGAPSTDSSNPLIRLKEIMEQRRKSMADSLEYDGMDEFTDNEITAEANPVTQSRLDPAFKAKLKRLREMYRRAIPDVVDPQRNWNWQNWLIWEYNNCRYDKQKKEIEARVDQYIEKHADKLQGEFVDLDVSNPQIDEDQQKLVAQHGNMNVSIMQNQ